MMQSIFWRITKEALTIKEITSNRDVAKISVVSASMMK